MDGREVGCAELTGAVAVETEVCRTGAQERECSHPKSHQRMGGTS